ncbi:hypothetical protein RB195_025245 [Necator americanus]|uniref:Uncharacterized protein n=1 Tax=Necator americanus TaxID=51031 RepID=A0ABR1ERH0_NECAM
MGDYGEGGDSVHFLLIAVKNGPEDAAPHTGDWRAPIEPLVQDGAPKRMKPYFPGRILRQLGRNGRNHPPLRSLPSCIRILHLKSALPQIRGVMPLSMLL